VVGNQCLTDDEQRPALPVWPFQANFKKQENILFCNQMVPTERTQREPYSSAASSSMKLTRNYPRLSVRHSNGKQPLQPWHFMQFHTLHSARRFSSDSSAELHRYSIMPITASRTFGSQSGCTILRTSRRDEKKTVEASRARLASSGMRSAAGLLGPTDNINLLTSIYLNVKNMNKVMNI
jgi:hypothetical protein